MPDVPGSLVDALAQALVEQGCPAQQARDLAARAELLDRGDGVVLVLEGQGIGAPDPGDTEDVAGAVSVLAENVAGVNAEAVDRAARGGPVRPVLWPLPGRARRRTVS